MVSPVSVSGGFGPNPAKATQLSVLQKSLLTRLYPDQYTAVNGIIYALTTLVLG